MTKFILFLFGFLISAFLPAQITPAPGNENAGSQLDTSLHMHPFVPNFSTITTRLPVITSELDSLTPQNFHSSPDYGILPENVPCSDCIELIQKRTSDSRYYIKNGTGGKTFYVQTSMGNINYVDSAGWMREINPSLKTPVAGIYKAENQPLPSTLNMNDGSTSIKVGNLTFNFNRNPKVYEIDGNTSTPLLNNFDLSSSNVGNNGVITHNSWTGIDRKIVFDEVGIETSYILSNMPSVSSTATWIAFEDEIILPAGYAIVRDTISGGNLTSEGYWQGALLVVNSNTGEQLLEWFPVVSYDNAAIHPDISNSAYQVIQNGNAFYVRALVKTAWLTDPARIYPITVDPLVSGAATYSAGKIGFTSYAPGDGYCGNSSAYCYGGPLNVNFPGQATITNVIWGANYSTNNPVWLSDVGFRMVGPCGEDPVNVDSWYSCGPPGGNAPGTCSGSGFIAPWLATCLAPSCSPSVIPFHIKNINCFWSIPVCGITYDFTINNTWTVTVQGQTIAHPNPPTSSAGTTFCPGNCTNLTATGQWGVPPYSYLWNPGAATTNPYNNVCPASSTTYTCTITDACGNTATNTVAITVTGCLPIELLSFTGFYEPQNDRVKLSWATATELLNSHFVIERTTDGSTFTALGQVESKAPGGNSSSTIQYQYYDTAAPSGTVYYRLRQVDLNGQNKITGLINVDISRNISGLSIVPNPADQNVQIGFNLAQAGITTIRIMDYSGREIRNIQINSVEGSNLQEISIEDLAHGFYFVQVSNNGATLNGKMIRK
ncbi:hypothetical protein BH09BAC5_BH09BAC5_08370 [soil metagenome]